MKISSVSSLSIREIEEILAGINSEDESIIEELKMDPRKGVETSLKRWYKQKYEEKISIKKYQEMSKYEAKARKAGYHFIAGLDEVGRGPLAGPVVSAAVILPENHYILGLNDSKKLTENTRKRLYKQIMHKAIAVSIGIISAEEIDKLNILQATKKSMRIALQNLKVEPDYLLIDAVQLDSIYPEKSIVKGDMNSASIAAASIIAKVTRDQMMVDYECKYPGYGFQEHKGYGTKRHLAAISQLGPSPIHRISFAPVRTLGEGRE